MIRYSSSVHKSDWECSSKSVRGSFFVNPLYIKNLTNLTNLTTLQTLQPYRFLCRVPKGPHAYLCTLHKGGPPAPCSVHNLCSLSENRGLPRRRGLTIQDLLRCVPARLQFGGLRARAHAWAKIWHGGGPGGLTRARVGAVFHLCFARSSQIGRANFGSKISARLHGSRPVRNDGLEPCEPSKIKRTHRSRSFWLPRRRSVVFSCLLQAADDIPEMHHRGGDGLNGIVIQ